MSDKTPAFKMESALFNEMLDTVKGGIPTLIGMAPDGHFTPGITITISDEGKSIKAEAHSETLSVVSAAYPLQSGRDGVLKIPASWAMNAKSKLPKDVMSMEQVKEDVVLKCGRFRTSSEQVECAIFRGQQENDTASLEVPASMFMEGLPVAINTMGVNDFRYMLNGVHIGHKQNTLSFSAANGHIGSCYKTHVTSGDTPDFEAVIPRKSILDIFALVKKHTDRTIHITVNNNQYTDVAVEAEFHIDDGPTISTPCISGKYPDVWGLFKNDQIEPRRVIFEADRAELVNTIKRVSSLSKEGGNPAILLKAKPGADTMSISLPQDGHNGRRKAQDEVAIVRKKGYDEEIDACFNGSFLISVLSPSKEKTTTLLIAPQSARETSIIDLYNDDPTVKAISPIHM